VLRFTVPIFFKFELLQPQFNLMAFDATTDPIESMSGTPSLVPGFIYLYPKSTKHLIERSDSIMSEPDNTNPIINSLLTP